MKNAFYARVSSDEQAEQGNIENQLQFAKGYFELYGIEAAVYLDEGVSGTIPIESRPAGARLIADVKAGKYKDRTLYVYRLDRLARSVKVVLDSYELLEAHGVALKSMTEAFDTSTPTGKFFMTLLASIAALERDTIMDRTLLGKERWAREGKWVSGPPPFGYRISEGRLEIHENEAEVVRLIYRLYLQEPGLSTIELAAYLNARNIPTPAVSKRTKNNSTGKWHAGHISIILRATAYAGTYHYLKRSKRKKETIAVPVPAIVTREEFTDAQARLTANADAARGSRGRSYLLRGLIFCGNCGRAMVGSSGHSKQGRTYYRCTGAMDTGAGKRCNAKMIRAKDIEEAVWQDIEYFVRNPDQVLELMQEQLEANRRNAEPAREELAQVETAVAEKHAARARVLSLCAKGVVTEAEAETELSSIAKEIESLAERREFLFAQQEAAATIEAGALNAKALMEGLATRLPTLGEEERLELAKGLVSRVEVFTEEKDAKRHSRAVIYYRFEDPGTLCDSKNLRRCLNATSGFSGTSCPFPRREISKRGASPSSLQTNS
ncbi:MAG: recombinase family protein [Ammonifex sp.]|nr:MAG: recombinase family protein [Ammonifex sp.]